MIIYRSFTDTTEVTAYAQMTDDDQRQVVITGLTTEPIRLTADDAEHIGASLLKLSGKTPVKEKRTQEVSNYIRSLSTLVQTILEAAPTVRLDPHGRAPSHDVLAVITAGWSTHGPRGAMLPTTNAFGRALRVLGHAPAKSNGDRYYTGLSIIDVGVQLSLVEGERSISSPTAQ
jgi:hypothetical protein